MRRYLPLPLILLAGCRPRKPHEETTLKTEWKIFIESILNPPKVEQLLAPKSLNLMSSALIAAPFCLAFEYLVFLAVKALF